MDLPTPFSHLHRSLLAAAAPQPSHASPALIGPHINSLRTSVAVIAGVLAAMFSVTLVLLVYSKHCKRHVGADDSADVGLVTVFPASSTSRRRSGVDRAVIEGLPVFRFGSLIGQKDGLECAVCLNRYGPDDALRLLPKCRHGFHVDCVDTWLDAHSSCPLCRARVDPGDVAIAIEPDRPVEMGTRKSKKVGEGFGKPRWVSGRHSSAGEKSTGLLPRFAADRSEPRDPRERRSVDRIGHRIVVTGGGDAAADQRWSKLRPSDFLLLRAEMIVASTRSSSTSRGSCSSAVVEM